MGKEIIKNMTNECNFWKIGFFALLMFTAGYITSDIYYENDNSSWDELTMTREAIENYDIVIEYIDAGKYEEATVLVDCIETSLWYLRNSDNSRTVFYEDLEFWDIRYYIEIHPETTKERIVEIQNKLCPKSDLSQVYWDNKKHDFEYNVSDMVRC